jgi:hypothetical protein
MDETKKELVLGTTYGYGVENIKTFAESLRKHFQGDVCFIVHRDIDTVTEEYLKKYNIDTFKFYVEPPGKRLQCLRYELYSEIIKSNYPEAKKVFLTDVRDVYFQASPFFFSFKEKLCFFREPVLIKNCGCNGPWMQKFAKSYEEICNNYVICSGTTLGTREGILDYCEKMKNEITVLAAFGSEDQAIHMRLIYTGAFDSFECHHSQEHAVTTCAHHGNLLFNRKIQVVNKNGTPTPVIHQYQRMEQLQKVILGNS